MSVDSTGKAVIMLISLVDDYFLWYHYVSVLSPGASYKYVYPYVVLTIEFIIHALKTSVFVQ